MPGLDYKSIQKLTKGGNYQVTVNFKYIKESLALYNVDLDPDFQRGHVWDEARQIAYVENRLRGETASQFIQLNNPGINSGRGAENTVLVDGKQRLTAVLAFYDNKIKAFGHYFSEMENVPTMDRCVAFQFCINDLKTRAEVLKWYLELNSGGIVHTEEELSRVQALLDAEVS
jgi:hypothetical protein